MSLKKVILRAKFKTKEDSLNTVEFKGDPQLFSSLYSSELGRRRLSNCPEKPFIKALIKKCPNPDTPCVLHVIFYVKPPSWLKLAPKDICDETTPATYSFELCDYLLYVLHLIFKTITTTHKQIIKINMEKFYSTKPRTYIKFLTWSDYLALHREDSVYPKTEN